MIQKKDSAADGRCRRAALRNQVFWLLMGCIAAGMISGCAITKDYQPPQVNIPESWRVDYQAAAELADASWWEDFQDPVLNELIQTALRENLDLRIAAARVEESAAVLETARSDYYPQINYGADASRRRESENRNFSFGMLEDRDISLYSGFLEASWEPDIWGRIRRASEAARAQLLSTEEARQAVILTLVSGVVNAYIELLKLDQELKISNETLASRQAWLGLFENKKQGGQVSELELAQVKSSYHQVAAGIPLLEMQIARLENHLSVLLGRPSGPIRRSRNLDTLVMLEVPTGVPSTILLRRPDIRASEQDLIAANARIGVARTLYFPTISLTGLIGYASSDLSDLAEGSSAMWEAGGGLLGPIFSGGRIKSQIRQAEAGYEALLNDYKSTILTAFQEVNDALVSMQKLRKRQEIQVDLVNSLKDYARYSRDSFDSGYTSYLTVLDAETKLFEAEIIKTQIKSDLFAATVDTYKAMGGGWIADPSGRIAQFNDGDHEPREEIEIKNP